ncbi:MAG TPA: NUDIX domain-containing protein [Candidatus Saccharimonadales bacterium]|jgi:8-oxo-dGTP pyrophosphatase MutT (NUDIX family)
MKYAFEKDREPIESGTWPGAEWDLYTTLGLSDEDCSAVFCMGVNSSGDTVLMKTMRELEYGREEEVWGLPGGHIDETTEGFETINMTRDREALEEGGFLPESPVPIAVRVIRRQPGAQQSTRGRIYPEVACIPYFLGRTPDTLLEPTGEEVLESGFFGRDEAMALINESDAVILDIGFAALESGHVVFDRPADN